MPNQDETAMRAVLDEVYSAWAANDADAFVAPYAERATAVHTGNYMQDREAIHATMAEVFAGVLKGSRGIHDVQSIRFVAADAAIVISRGAILLAGQAEPAAESRTRDGWVLAKHDGAWRVEAFHNCSENGA